MWLTTFTFYFVYLYHNGMTFLKKVRNIATVSEEISENPELKWPQEENPEPFE